MDLLGVETHWQFSAISMAARLGSSTVKLNPGGCIDFGGIIRWDREHSGHSAGLRTNTLVGMGAALFTDTSDLATPRSQPWF